MARYPLKVQALRYRSVIHARIGSGAVVSYARRGAVLRARRRPGGKAGWLSLRGGGAALLGPAFQRLQPPQDPPRDLRAPDLGSMLPYAYGKVVRKGAYRYDRLPTEAERLALAHHPGRPAPGHGLGATPLDGAYFVAIDRHFTRGARCYYRLVDGHYIDAAHVRLLQAPMMHGALLSGTRQLPLAFVVEKEARLYRTTDGALRTLGVARRHSRFPVTARRRSGPTDYVVGPAGLLLRRQDVRVARKSGRPYYASAKTRWIHIDLSEQTLVAYLGSRPVFATLVSTGKPARATPTGHFRIHWKHVSITMRGQDEKAGVYEVAEVPWTMYYQPLYALHGAYWHNEFGRVRSHGCTNLAPADAYWLFHWTRPVRPASWHSVRAQGTRLVITP